MYLKRQKVPKTWPTERKGTKYVVSPNSNADKGIPILVVVRDILKMAQNRKEVKRAIHSQQILINDKKTKDDKNAVLLFDLVTILSADKKIRKKYRLELSDKKKFIMVDVPEETDSKIAKVIDKKTLKGKKTQINLSDGRNFISDVKCNVNDSIVVDLKDNKIKECLPLEVGSPAMVFEGKHLGMKGIIKGINPQNIVISSGKEEINVLIKQLMVLK